MFQQTRSVQQMIPVKRAFEDGIFLMDNGTYTQTFRFSDVNYATASKLQKESILLKYCDVINGVPAGQITQIDIVSRALHMEQLGNSLYTKKDDGLDRYRKEMNSYIMKQKDSGNGIIQELYITLSVTKKNEHEARLYFNRTALEIGARFNRIGSVFAALNLNERLRLLHDIYRMNSKHDFRFDLKESMRNSHRMNPVILWSIFGVSLAGLVVLVVDKIRKRKNK